MNYDKIIEYTIYTLPLKRINKFMGIHFTTKEAAEKWFKESVLQDDPGFVTTLYKLYLMAKQERAKEEKKIKSISEFEEIYLPQVKKEKEMRMKEKNGEIGRIWAKEVMRIVKNIICQEEE